MFVREVGDSIKAVLKGAGLPVLAMLLLFGVIGHFTAEAVTRQHVDWRTRLLAQHLDAMTRRIQAAMDTASAGLEHMGMRLGQGAYNGLESWHADARLQLESVSAIKGIYLWFPGLSTRWQVEDEEFRATAADFFDLSTTADIAMQGPRESSTYLVPISIAGKKYGFHMILPFTTLSGQRGYLFALLSDELLFSQTISGTALAVMDLHAEMILKMPDHNATVTRPIAVPGQRTEAVTKRKDVAEVERELELGGLAFRFVGRPNASLLKDTGANQAELIRIVFLLCGLVSGLLWRVWIVQRGAMDSMRVANEKLEHARRESEVMARNKSVFLSTMSHEVRTPMNGILGLTNLLSDTRLTAYQRDLISTIQGSGESLLRILNDVLDHSKLEAGGIAFERVDFSPALILGELQRLMSGQAQKKKNELLLELDENLPQQVNGDPHRVRQILLNLISNAIKFSEGGTVTLRAVTGGGDDIEFSVTDTGIGMREDQLPKIFNAFEQADSSISRRFGGTGLGLNISRNLAVGMGGDLLVSSEYGKGSCFTLRLPLSAQRQRVDDKVVARREAQGVPQSVLSGDLAKLKVLVVEDNFVNQMVITGFLKKMGLVADLAENGQEALERINARHYDLVFMDMQMPVMDGLQAAREMMKLAHQPRKTRLPVIIAQTANIQAEDRTACLLAGMVDVLSKPITYESLHQAVVKWGGLARHGERIVA